MKNTIRTMHNDIKSALEIGTLASQLNPKNQSYVLNTINALIFAQQSIEGSGENADNINQKDAKNLESSLS